MITGYWMAIVPFEGRNIPIVSWMDPGVELRRRAKSPVRAAIEGRGSVSVGKGPA